MAELAHDTHSTTLFDNPRWAADLATINALECHTCHGEHRVATGGVTVEPEFCFPCHDDVIEKRASHRDFAPNGCGAAGCHNYHDNSSLTTAFLSLNRGKPEVASPALLPSWKPAPTGTTSGTNAVAPPSLGSSPEIERAVAASAHAGARVGCGDCHQGEGEAGQRPGIAVCQRCHTFEAETFTTGRHGSRLRVELEPLSPSEARLPMKPRSTRQPAALDCSSCHDPHSVDTRPAATEACLACHDDAHSRNFAASPHAALPGAQEVASRTAVTCATCHLPRTEVAAGGHIAVNHNNSFTMRPTDRMARLVCISCHSLELSLSSVLDPQLVASNFLGRPSDRHPTFVLMEAYSPSSPGEQNASGGSR